jgi:hypothetical protein
MRNKSLLVIGATAAVALASAGARADVSASLSGPAVTSDTTLYSDNPTHNAGGTSSGYAGQTVAHGFRRMLLRFDLSSIPSNATIVSATLDMRITQVPTGGGNVSHALHRVSNSWVEGTVSTASGAGGALEAGSASWNSRQEPGVPWSTPGGDYAGTASATTPTGSATGPVSWTGPGLAADIQAWVNGSQPNHGWIVIGDETVTPSARRYESKESTTPSFRPTLTVWYSPAAGIADWKDYD